jgi:hypothetical protein
MALTPSNSAAVTAVPLGRLRAFVVSLRVKVTGKVAVVPVGMASLIIIVRYPTG